MNAKLSQLQQQGCRITRAREELVNLFDGEHVILSIPDIQRSLGKNVDRATIYRNIKFLEQNNIISSFVSNEQTFYELSENEHHHHLICIKCGSKTEFLPKVIESAINDAKTIAKDDYNFVVTDHQLEFYGYCQKCKEL